MTNVTPLHDAVQLPNPHIVRLLLEVCFLSLIFIYCISDISNF